jgi:hypothetical protein
LTANRAVVILRHRDDSDKGGSFVSRRPVLLALALLPIGIAGLIGGLRLPGAQAQAPAGTATMAFSQDLGSCDVIFVYTWTGFGVARAARVTAADDDGEATTVIATDVTSSSAFADLALTTDTDVHTLTARGELFRVGPHGGIDPLYHSLASTEISGGCS